MTTTAPEHHPKPLLGLRNQPGRLALQLMRMPVHVYRRGWGRLLGRTFLLITHAGRTSGTRYDTVAMALSYDVVSHEVVVCSAWGPNTDWIRNIRRQPALQIRIGSESYTPEHRFLTEEESLAVALEFRRRHQWRLRILAAILGWGDLSSEAALTQFVQARPFVSFRPTRTRAAGEAIHRA